PLRLHVRRVERAYHGEHGLYVARVVADAGRVELAVAHLDLYLQALLKDRVHVRVNDNDRAAARAAARGDDVAYGVAPNVERFVAAQQVLDEGCALPLLARRRVRNVKSRGPCCVKDRGRARECSGTERQKANRSRGRQKARGKRQK